MRLLKSSMLTLVPVLMFAPTAWMQTPPAQALAGFDNLTNGHLSQPDFDIAKAAFEATETEADGLGPVFNDRSCAACHNIGAVGGASSNAELRAGRTVNGNFTAHRGDSLIHGQATDPEIMESVDDSANTFSQRISLSVLGDGYVEATANGTLQGIAAGQPAEFKGSIVMVPVVESPGTMRVGRFGHKDQQASLESFAGDAYLNEMGITNLVDSQRGFDHENTSNGRVVENDPRFDKAKNDDGSNKPDPEDDGEDVEFFATFMRSTKVPPRGPITAAVLRGNTIFNNIECDECHRNLITSAPAGTSINGGAELVSEALGNKQYHPFGDFLMHDVGTGDGIVQNGGPSTRRQVRTIPLWGLRIRNRLMHDGATSSIREAILRHAGQATRPRNSFAALTGQQLADFMAFMRSL